jgi:asparagine synthase (glutamine-hydrolysing)
MCGIVGIVGGFRRDECRAIVQRMTDAIVHRGPDDEGIWCDDGVGIGMRRLSIIDLAGGHQPMQDEDAGVTVVFNGEIYNYAALRDELAKRTTLNTHSDTEVVLKTFARDGVSAIDTWNGMFGIAAWDAPRRTLTLIRDRMGVKPLYYFWDGQTLLFASELKALLASGLVPRQVNTQALWDYLTFRYVPGPESVWCGIRKLPPGSVLKFAIGSEPREEAYWRADVDSEDADDWNFEQAEAEFASLFLDAVQLRLVAADVPVGVLLSGGLDSSAVAAAAVELGHRNFHTFSIGFDDPDYSELGFARQMARCVDAQHHEIVMNREEFLATLPDAVFHLDEPLADLASVPLLAVSRLARQNVKVVLSGEGSDEILAGYHFDREVQRIERIRRLQQIPRPLLLIGERVGTAVLGEPFARRAARIAHEPLEHWNRRDLPHISQVFAEDEKRRLWDPPGVTSSAHVLEREYASARSADPLQQMLAVYQQSWLVEDLLMKADKMSMATSLELRTPFLDYRLVKWANRQPNRLKVARNGSQQYVTKYVLRRFADKRLPAEILTRPKQGFPVPAYRWFQTGLGAWARDVLLGSDARFKRAIARNVVSELVQSAERGHLQAAHKVWLLIVLELWLRAWAVDLDTVGDEHLQRC